MLDKAEGEERFTKLRDCPLMWTVRGDAIQNEPSKVQIQGPNSGFKFRDQIQATVIVDLSLLGRKPTVKVAGSRSRSRKRHGRRSAGVPEKVERSLSMPQVGSIANGFGNKVLGSPDGFDRGVPQNQVTE